MAIYEVIVVGGGHAGIEAAMASARLGCKTLLITQQIETLGQMSCNPAIGGIGKGHLVKEIDALGGIMAEAADEAGIQFRYLNASKGPAVKATRAQADRQLYRQAIRRRLEKEPHLQIFQQTVDSFLIESGRVTGVLTQLGLKFQAKAVVLTAGTFLAGKIHIGETQLSGGRAGDAVSLTLAHYLRDLPFRFGRLKTGTPPRLDGRTLNYSHMVEQPGDQPTPVFSFLGRIDQHPSQVSCYITHTTPLTHEIIQENLSLSAMYSGKIEGIGPRYCPSIEDKIVRFADKLTHQIFVEPEGLQTYEIYPNGLSTSLPYSVQEAFIRSIKGFEKAHITRPGYAIEYDFFDPRDLHPWLQTKQVEGLFFAGQINGTTGYEEAAAQGLIAGLNAARFSQGKPPWYPKRHEAYIGVLIDDLVTLGTQEPYRMFTSRAEYRLILREDNADLRLTEQGHELGLVSEKRWRAFCEKRDAISTIQQKLKQTTLFPQWVQPLFEYKGLAPLVRECKAIDLLKRPEITVTDLQAFILFDPDQHYSSEAWEQVGIQVKYQGYIDRQYTEIARLQKHEETLLSPNFPYDKVSGLSNEVKQKWLEAKPTTVGQASRIPGITPAAVSLLLIYLKKKSLMP